MPSRFGQLAIVRTAMAVAVVASIAPAAFAQAPAATPGQAGRGGGPGAQAPAFVSPEVAPDRRITFRIHAPAAQAVRLTAGDIPGVGQTTQLTQSEHGVWDVTVGPVEPGAYRYTFNVDGVATIDPRSPFISESNNNVWSLVHVPGSDVSDTKNVLLWFGTGKDDFLLTTTIATVDLMKTHGFTPVYKETPGGHTWLVWRAYLHEFVPQLFK